MQGDPPLTSETIDKSADFFRWALGGNFTADEMNEYEQFLIRIWEANDAGSIKVIGDIVRMRDDLVVHDTEKLKTLVP